MSECKTIKIDYSGIPSALGKHVFPNFIAFIGEFIDNSISAAEANEWRPNINLFLDEKSSDHLVLTIQDYSGGIEEKYVENLIFNPGCCTPKRGYLNNHGIGLKQALYVQQYPNKENWELITYSQDTIKNGYGLKIRGPLIDCQTKIEKFELPSKDILPGTHLVLQIRENILALFEELYRHKNTKDENLLEKRVYRLHELLGWHYSHILEVDGNIKIFYKPKEKENFIEEKIYPVNAQWNETCSTREYNIQFDGKIYKFKYQCGAKKNEPEFIKTQEFKKTTPNYYIYPTKIYKKVPANAGIDITIGGEKRGKRLCRIPLKDIFDIDTSKLSFESYHGELFCPPDLPHECINNVKNTINHYHTIISSVFDLIRKETKVSPRNICSQITEQDLYEGIKKILLMRGEVIDQFKVTNKAPSCGNQKVDFILKINDYTYEIIEVTLYLDVNHIYKLHFYRTAIESGWSNIDVSPEKRPKIIYKLIAKLPEKNKSLEEFCSLMGFILEDPSKYNLDYDLILQEKERKNNIQEE